jgi:hypothetical protein
MPSQSETPLGQTDRAESLAWTSLSWFIWAWMPALGLTILSSAIFAGIAHGSGAGFAVLGVSLAIATASGTVGWLFGLLFGIPRSLARVNVPLQASTTGVQTAAKQSTEPQTVAAQSTAPQTAAAQSTAPQAATAQPTAPQTVAAQSTAPQAAAMQSTAPQAAATQSTEPPTATASANTTSDVPRSAINTNLEDISDWLTKTIIGVGLTQLYSIPHVAWSYATKLDKAALPTDGGGGAVLILSLATAAAAGAFWVGYVTTRTILTKLFDMFDR